MMITISQVITLVPARQIENASTTADIDAIMMFSGARRKIPQWVIRVDRITGRALLS
jgi:hypothetical protein